DRVHDAARNAPSGSNRQPWKFILVTDEKLKEKLVTFCHGQAFLAQAPVVIAACGRDIEFDRGDWMGKYSMLVDVTIGMDHFILAARAEGLGTCWIGSFNNDQVKGLLGVPDRWEVVALTPLGYPEGDPFGETHDRKPLSEIVCVNHWE
ncbi:MAG: nitroreductase family protein, partial [Armatimonadota bacterium]